MLRIGRGRQRLEHLDGLAIGVLRFRQPAQLAMDVPHLLVGPAVLQPHRRVAGDPAGELLVIGQGVLEEFLLERVELLVEADIGDLGEQVDGVAGLLALGLGLVPLAETSTVLTPRAIVAVTSKPAAAETDVLCRRPTAPTRAVQGSANALTGSSAR